ncbi:MAG: SpoIIE family protein phosphatase [Deltaproteobacteria bacterium]|nr:SpoIIE family protein phosphatase [Deltaproteobacteria bacterium]MBW2317158.1 SpoIIE family protein phosphatase [Deltaproteobacteria bacterium]MBW2601202.1 SpoIIE family protein phosphatase [Deltaproteobacteria bacterium]
MPIQILIVEDDKLTRNSLCQIIQKLDYEVMTASDGLEAWNILREKPVDIVITDWMMPGMDGLELCKRIRSADLRNYVYVIILTARGGKKELIEAIDAGADDFAVKPSTQLELSARIKAGKRILKLQSDLKEQNEKLSKSNRKLNHAYSVIKKDLEAGAKIQSSLLPQKASIISGISFDWIFLPSEFVAGDVFNYFRLDENHVGFYVLDVAGHGIPAAMLSVTLSKALSPANTQECLLKQFMPVPEPPYYKIINPATAIKMLNERFQADPETMQYFTIVYGIIDIQNGETVITQAGHPCPILLQKGTSANLIGKGGFPVGMLPNIDYEEQEIVLNRGDRLFAFSDGITECINSKQQEFSPERLMDLVEEGRNFPLRKLLELIEHRLHQWKGDNTFEDDVTLLAIEIT